MTLRRPDLKICRTYLKIRKGRLNGKCHSCDGAILQGAVFAQQCIPYEKNWNYCERCAASHGIVLSGYPRNDGLLIKEEDVS
jgi:Zn finger protein HypA/HybF involved in hydrogenase expression